MSTPPEEEATAPVQVGDVLASKYRVERVLGIGGMGAVVAARHLDLGELRALKFMLPKVAAEEEASKRFLREARAAARLKSEHVATIHDVGRLNGGEPYMVMEYLEGDDLASVLKNRGRLPIDEAIDLTLQALSGLAEAHSLGIVHRDLKPPNLFVSEGSDGLARLKVLDFGVSKLIGPVDVPELSMTKTNAMLGSPHYMSPEQMECTRDVDGRTDIWSIGVLLYEMVTGKVPFDAPSITALTVLVVNKEPESPRVKRPEISRALERVIVRCLAKNPDDRYATVAELARDLVPFAAARGRLLAESIGRVADVRGRMASGLDKEEVEGVGVRPTRAASPMAHRDAEDRSKTEATWGDAGPRWQASGTERLRRAAPLLVGAAGILVVAAVIARPWASDPPLAESARARVESEAPPVASSADEPPVEPSVTASVSAAVEEPAAASASVDVAEAAPAASASASASATATTSAESAPSASAPPKGKKRRRRVDIYDGLDDDPYEERDPYQ
jgi:eukaryotic-like serine/threonine-protein kinase